MLGKLPTWSLTCRGALQHPLLTILRTVTDYEQRFEALIDTWMRLVTQVNA